MNDEAVKQLKQSRNEDEPADDMTEGAAPQGQDDPKRRRRETRSNSATSTGARRDERAGLRPATAAEVNSKTLHGDLGNDRIIVVVGAES